ARLAVAGLRTMPAAALEEGLVVADAAAALGRALKLGQRAAQRAEKVKAMTWEQRDRFLATAERLRPWWFPAWAVQVRTGLRPGELWAFEEGDLDLDARVLHVRRTLADHADRVELTPKGGRPRPVALSTEACRILRAYLVRRREETLRRGWPGLPQAFFCSHTGAYAIPSTVRREMRAVLKAAGLPSFSPHALRHTFASLYLTTAPHPDLDYLKRQLGHATIGLTCDVYGRWLPKSPAEQLAVLDRPPGTSTTA